MLKKLDYDLSPTVINTPNVSDRIKLEHIVFPLI